jgi:hypothetical protein
MRSVYSKHCALVVGWFLPLFLLTIASQAAGPIVVSGLVKDAKSLQVLASFNVGLYPDEKGAGGQMATDGTNEGGLYSMQVANVGGDVREVWVLSEVPQRSARPVWVSLPTEGVPNRLAKAKDLLVSSVDALSVNDMEGAANYTAGIIESHGIRLYCGVINADQAQQRATKDTYPVLVMEKRAGDLAKFWDTVEKLFQERIRANEGLWDYVKELYNFLRTLDIRE